MDIDFEAKGTCQLCGGREMVEVVPNGLSGGNDAQLDECPWCLRRRLNQQQRVLADAGIMMRQLLAKPTQSRRERAWRFLQKHGLQGSILRAE